MHLTDPGHRRALAVATVAASLYLAVAALVFGFFIALGDCGLAGGSCSEPQDDGGVGSLMVLASPVILFGGLALGARLGGGRGRAARVLLAPPLAVTAGVLVAHLLPGVGYWGETLVLHAAVITGISVIVPPTGPRWWVAATVGGVLSAALFPGLGMSPAGVGVGILPLVVAALGTGPAEPMHPTELSARPLMAAGR